MTILDRPSSSHDLDAADFYSFTPQKSAMKGWRLPFSAATDIIKNAIAELQRTSQYGFATVPFPCGYGIVASRFFSVRLKVLSQGNLRRRSVQGPRSATTG